MPIEARGRKDPVLAAAIKNNRLPAETTLWEYVVGRRPLKVGEETRQPGDPIPEAATWPRLESWIRSGAVAQLPKGAAEAVVAPAEPVRARPARTVASPVTDEAPARPVLRPRKGASA